MLDSCESSDRYDGNSWNHEAVRRLPYYPEFLILPMFHVEKTSSALFSSIRLSESVLNSYDTCDKLSPAELMEVCLGLATQPDARLRSLWSCEYEFITIEYIQRRSFKFS